MPASIGLRRTLRYITALRITRSTRANISSIKTCAAARIDQTPGTEAYPAEALPHHRYGLGDDSAIAIPMDPFIANQGLKRE